MGPQAPPAATTCRVLTLVSGGTGAQASGEPGLHENGVDCQARRTVARPINRSSRAKSMLSGPTARLVRPNRLDNLEPSART